MPKDEIMIGVALHGKSEFLDSAKQKSFTPFTTGTDVSLLISK
jgi:hypothetical protein